MVAVAERVPAHVIGDGSTPSPNWSTWSTLTRGEASGTRRCSPGSRSLLLLRNSWPEQGFGMDDVPDAGVEVALAATGNMSTGGISIDRTYEAHPDNVEVAEGLPASWDSMWQDRPSARISPNPCAKPAAEYARSMPHRVPDAHPPHGR